MNGQLGTTVDSLATAPSDADDLASTERSLMTNWGRLSIKDNSNARLLRCGADMNRIKSKTAAIMRMLCTHATVGSERSL
jgi:hypothetical protein